MNRPAVPLLTHLRYLVRRAGWPALAGAALLAGAAAVEFGPRREAQDKLAGLRASISKARAQRAAPERATADAANLLAALPGREALDGIIAGIHQAAAAQGLVTSGAEYRQRKEAGGEVLRYEIALPLTLAYAPLRAWLAQLLAQQPAMTIDEINLHRDTAENGQLEGRLRLVLFLRARSSAALSAASAQAGPVAEGSAVPPPTLPTPRFAAPAGELFAMRSWQPPPPLAPPPPKPTAPPLPFKYAGKLIEDKAVQVFLSHGDTTTLVKQGDRLGNYDIERITTSSVVLLYRPLQEQQTLNFGGDD